jgi:hypothetical protein
MQKYKMKYKATIVTLTMSAISFLAINVHAQEQVSASEQHRQDSVQMASAKDAQIEKTKDEARMANVKLDRKQTKAKAKNAQRIENEATDAAQQSKYAVRSERKAQKSRARANKQAEKALKARTKSDKN